MDDVRSLPLGPPIKNNIIDLQPEYTINQEELAKFLELLKKNAGIAHLPGSAITLRNVVIQRMNHLNIKSAREYYELLSRHKGADELSLFISSVVVSAGVCHCLGYFLPEHF